MPKWKKKMTIGVKHNEKENEPTPGPTDYNLPMAEVNHEEFPKWSFLGRPTEKEKLAGPGPAEYQIKEHKWSKKGVSMKGVKEPKVIDHKVPGVGSYNTNMSNVEYEYIHYFVN